MDKMVNFMPISRLCDLDLDIVKVNNDILLYFLTPLFILFILNKSGNCPFMYQSFYQIFDHKCIKMMFFLIIKWEL